MTEQSFSIVITDLIGVWFRHCDKNSLHEDNAKFFPQLSMATPKLIELIRERIIEPNSGTTHSISINKISNELQLTITSKLQLAAQVLVPFSWIIFCRPLNQPSSSIIHSKDLQHAPNSQAEFLRDQVIYPLLGVVQVLFNQFEEFKRLLVERDTELQQLRESCGSSVRVKRTSTPFDVIGHENEVLHSQRLQEQFGNSKSLSFDSPFLAGLYEAYMENSHKLEKPPHHLTTSEIGHPELETQNVDVPAQAEDAISPSTATASTRDSPHKTTSVAAVAKELGLEEGRSRQETTAVEKKPKVYKESDQERKRRLELEEELESKRRKKDQKSEKKKLKSFF